MYTKTGVNLALLEYEMKRNGITAEKLCEILDISLATFYRKRKGITEFTLMEIKEIVKALNLDSPMDIFFSPEVS